MIAEGLLKGSKCMFSKNQGKNFYSFLSSTRQAKNLKTI
jgi:hypothetical protein